MLPRSLRLLVALVLTALTIFGLGSACTSDVSTSLEGLECDSSQRCVDGYECDLDTNTCVKLGSSSGSGGGAGETSTGTCQEGETVCGGECVVLDDDVENCGRCGATCTAPPLADPFCASGRCEFFCESEELTRCGDQCLDTRNDVE